MRPSLPVLIPFLVAVATAPAPVAAQATICGGLNHLTNTSNATNLAAGTWLAVLFTPQASGSGSGSIGIDRLRFYFPNQTLPGGGILVNSAAGTCEIRTADAATGLPSGTILASGTFGTGGGGGPIQVGGGWRGANFNSSIVLAAGQAYYAVYTRSPAGGGAVMGTQDSPPGPDITPFSLSPDGVNWSPLSTANQWKVRFVDSQGGCQPPGPAAGVTLIGPGCPGSGSFTPQLNPVGLPVLGNATFTFDIDGGPAAGGAPYGLFWSLGSNPAGQGLGGGCTLWLELVSFLALQAQGFNPLASGILDPAGRTTVPVPVPGDPALLGVQFGFQAALVVPFGVPTGVPGVAFVLTDGQLGTVGY